MIIKTNDGWEFPKHTVIYAEKGEVIEKPIGEEGKAWWEAFSKQWNIPVEFTDLHYTDGEIARLAKCAHIGEGYAESVEHYALTGEAPDSEPFRMMRLEQAVADLAMLQLGVV
mgnify:CR=1 FL=1